MILPTGATSFKQAMQMGCEVYHNLKAVLKKNFGIAEINVGDEGGFASQSLKDENHTLEIIMEAIKQSGHEGKIQIGLDVAASEFYNEEAKTYDFGAKAGEPRVKNAEEATALFAELVAKYPIITIEDPFDQSHYDAWQHMQKELGDKI